MEDAKLKDSVLMLLCNEFPIERVVHVKLHPTLDGLGIEFDIFNVILIEFMNLGFISDVNLRRLMPEFIIKVNYSAKNFLLSGGFSVQQKNNKLLAQKLELEIALLYKELNDLQLSHPTLAERMISILSNIATIVGVSTSK